MNVDIGKQKRFWYAWADYSLLMLLLLPFLAGCWKRPMPEPQALRLFRNNQIRIEAPFDRIDTAQQSVIITRVDPHFTGTGHVGVSIRRWPPVMSPKFKLDEVFDSTITVRFVKDVSVSTRWVFQFPDRDNYQVLASAGCDSIFVADSNRYYSSGSEIALRTVVDGGDSVSYGAVYSEIRSGLYLYP